MADTAPRARFTSGLLELARLATEVSQALAPDLDSTPPGWSPHWTYRSFLEYLAFHVAYHTGQMYSARHLLGETPPDN